MSDFVVSFATAASACAVLCALLALLRELRRLSPHHLSALCLLLSFVVLTLDVRPTPDVVLPPATATPV